MRNCSWPKWGVIGPRKRGHYCGPPGGSPLHCAVARGEMLEAVLFGVADQGLPGRPGVNDILTARTRSAKIDLSEQQQCVLMPCWPLPRPCLSLLCLEFFPLPLYLFLLLPITWFWHQNFQIFVYPAMNQGNQSPKNILEKNYQIYCKQWIL